MLLAMRTPIEESLHLILRCEKQELGRGFYPRFFAECPQAAQFFEGVELRAQANILVNSLNMIVCHAVHGYPAAVEYLKLLGHRHQALGIPQDLYPDFCRVLLQTIADFHGDNWNEGLAKDWRHALELAAAAMNRGCSGERLTY